MASPLALAGQAAAYLFFAAVVGVFSSAPAYRHFPADQAQIKMSFSHAGQLRGECRRLSAEEIAALPANMRRPLDCPRERLPLVIELDLDGQPLYRDVAEPSGLAGDSAASVYRRFAVPLGHHRLDLRLRDSARSDGFDYTRTAEVELAARQNLVIDFNAKAGGFLLR